MHACPTGYVLTGINVASNLLLCGEYWSLAKSTPIRVGVFIENLQAFQTTDTPRSVNTRDEVYVFVKGSITELREGNPVQIASVGARLPRYINNDDYYEFFNFTRGKDAYTSWTNQDQAPVGKPTIWEGELVSGQTATFVVVIGEQDNKDTKDYRDLCNGLSRAGSTRGTATGSTEVQTIAKGASELCWPNSQCKHPR